MMMASRTARAGLRVLFFGSDDFALPTLKALHRSSKAHVAALDCVCPARSNFRRRSGPLPVARYCEEHGLPVHPVGPEHRGTLAAWDPPASAAAFDLAVVVSFGYFLPRALLERFPLGAVNLHPSLLPRWRGASPVQHTLLHGDARAGVSVIDVHPTRMDAGDVLAQAELEGFDGGAGAGARVTHAALRASLAELGASAVADVAGRGRDAFVAAREASVPQAALLQAANGDADAGDADAQPRAPKVTKAMGEVVFAGEGAAAVARRWRALGDGAAGGGGCWATLDGRRVKLIELAGVVDDDGGESESAAAGTWQMDRRCRIHDGGDGEAVDKAVTVVCADGARVAVTRLQMEGKKPATGEAFNNGFKAALGDQLFA